MTDVDAAELLACGRQGAELDLSTGDRRLDAGLIRELCRRNADDIDPQGLTIRGGHVVGGLDLAGVIVRFPLRFEGCAFDAPIIADGADLQQLTVTGAPRLPGILGNGLRVRRDLDLSGSTISGAHRTSASTSRRSAIWLSEAAIGGRLLCVGTVIHADGERAVQADRLSVGGNVRMIHRFTATGEVRLIGVHIGGSLDLTGVELSSPTGICLDLGEATIGGTIFLVPDGAGNRPILKGRIDVGGATVGGQFLIRDATLREHDDAPSGSTYAQPRISGTAVHGPQLHVDGDLTVQGETVVTGAIDLSLSHLGRLTVQGGAALRHPGKIALDLTNAEVASALTIAPGVTTSGSINLRGTRIRGDLRLRGTILTDAGDESLIAAHGAVIDGAVDLAGAHLNNPTGQTVNLQNSTVGGSVRLVEDFRSEGSVILDRSVINGRLGCRDGTFRCPTAGGHAIQAISATVRGGMYLGWRAVEPSVDFTNATTTVIADDPTTWPSRFVISGLRYDTFARLDGAVGVNPWAWRRRRDWLARQAEFDSGPYEQAAQVFRRHGHTGDAENLLMERQRHARRAAPPMTRLGSIVAAVTIGHGYRPGRMLGLLLLLLVLVTVSVTLPFGQSTMRAADTRGIVYTTDGPLNTVDRDGRDACGNGQVRCFHAVLYAVDTVVPLIALHQRSTWYPSHFAQHGEFMEWWLNVAAVLGWVFSSIYLLSFTRIARNV